MLAAISALVVVVGLATFSATDHDREENAAKQEGQESLMSPIDPIEARYAVEWH